MSQAGISGKYMARIRRSVPLLALAMVPACVDITHEFHIAPAGTLRLDATWKTELHYEVNFEVENISPQEKQKLGEEARVKASARECASAFEGLIHPGDRRQRILSRSSHVEDETLYCQLSLVVTDPQAAYGALEEDESERYSSWHIRRNGEELIYMHRYGAVGDENDKDKEAAEYFDGRTFTIIIHAPRIIDANGEINAARDTVTWRIPMREYAVEARDTRLTARIGLRAATD